MSEERKRILDMLADGTITVDEAMMLLGEVESPAREAAPEERPVYPKRTGDNRMLRIRVMIAEEGQDKPTNVNVNLPLKVARVVGQIVNMLPEAARDALDDKGIDLSSIDWDDMIDALADTGGDIVNVTQEDEDEQVVVRIYVE